MASSQMLFAFFCGDESGYHGDVDESGIHAVDVNSVLRVIQSHLLGHSDDLEGVSIVRFAISREHCSLHVC